MIWLIIAHYIGDWGLQNQFMAMTKGRWWLVMLSHSILWTGCVCIALQYLGIYTLWKFVFLVIGHYVMDKWKTTKDGWSPYIYIDQGWHLIQLVIVRYL